MQRSSPFRTRFGSVILLTLFGACTSVVHAAEQRCDLVSQSGCIDVSKLDGASIQVPLSTTRISSSGLTLCGVVGTTPPPTDIVYVVDQTGSMLPTAIQIQGNDTSGYFTDAASGKPCNLRGTGTMNFHDASAVDILPSTLSEAQVQASCAVAGDPFGVRSSAVQMAISSQATRAPGSYAATVNFAATVNSTQDSMTLLNNAGVATLQATVPNRYLSATNYEVAITWARILLYGGSSRSKTIQPSKHANKAIIMISDGRPNTDNWERALNASNTTSKVDNYTGTWTTGSPTIPPVYTIYLGVDTINGSVLQTLSGRTGGKYYKIPPSKPDSLGRVIQQIMGLLIKPVVPDSLFVTNISNGQASHSVAVAPKSGSYQMALDSLVALEPGNNKLKVAVKSGENIFTANWTILVADSTGPKPKGSLDSLLTTQCGAPSAISLKPDKSGLAWADTVDRNLLIGLSAMPENYSALPVSLSTRKSADMERISMAVPAGSDPQTTFTFRGSLPWQNLSGKNSVPGDTVLRSGPGWDSARAHFQMPRDRRDTASVMIGLHHPSVPVLTMTASVEGPSGLIAVSVLDSEITTTSVVVTVRHSQGDSLKVKLLKGADGLFHGSFPFAEGIAADAMDTLLQMGLVMAHLDSIAGSYLSQKASTIVTLPTARLRFVDAAGTPRDTISLSLAMGGKLRVTVQEFIGNVPCKTCNNRVAISPSDLGISIHEPDGAGDRIDALRLTNGRAVVEVRGEAPVLAGSISFVADSIGSSVVAKPVRVDPLVPDSVVYFDDDGDGTLDRADVHLRMPWHDGNRLQLPWPDSTKLLDWASADLSLSSDSLVASFGFHSSVPLTTGAKGKLIAKWRYSDVWDWSNVKVVERVAPVPLRAILRRGTIYDTLRVSSSEKIWPVLAPNNKLVTNVFADGTFGTISPLQARLDATTGDLLLVFNADSTDLQVKPCDSIRFTRDGALRDSLGNVSGEFARQVIVEGLDRAPSAAFIFDTDADGRADRIVVHLRAPLTLADRIGFRWPDTLGNLQERELPVAAATLDSLDCILTFDVEPFAFGATSCPREGCQNLGWLSSTRFPDAGKVPFAIQDRIDPIILNAHFAFSATGKTLDTLYLKFSEPLNSAATGPWIAWGKPSTDSLGTAVIAKGTPKLVGGDRVTILVDSTFPARPGDSVRIFAKPTGALSDTSRNAPGSFAFWTRLEFGLPPLIINVTIPTPILIDRGDDIPAGQEPITILVRKDPNNSNWSTLQGQSPLQPASSYSGLILNINRIPEGGGLYIYDLIGTGVIHFDLSSLIAAANAGQIERTRRGDYQIFFAWDGRDMNRQKVATGIYIARVFGWVRENNHRSMVNVLQKVGIRRELPTNMWYKQNIK